MEEPEGRLAERVTAPAETASGELLSLAIAGVERAVHELSQELAHFQRVNAVGIRGTADSALFQRAMNIVVFGKLK